MDRRMLLDLWFLAQDVNLTVDNFHIRTVHRDTIRVLFIHWLMH